MFEALLFFLFAGFLLSLKKSNSIINPFFIYFLIWLVIFILIYVDQGSYISFSDEFLAILITAKLLSLFFLVICSYYLNSREEIIKNKNMKMVIEVRTRLLDLGLLIGTSCLPLVYSRALEISSSANIFSVLGYIALRSSMTDDSMGYGVYSYVMLMTYVATSIRFLLYLQTKKNGIAFLLSILIALSYVYLSTGRTFVVLLFSMLVVPGIIVGEFKTKSIIAFLLIVLTIFVLIATMTSKGVSLDVGINENILSIFESLRSYVVAPILACNVLFDTLDKYEFGQNTFRTLFVFLNVIQVIDIQVGGLIKGYVEVPWPTNVYTVYEIYFKDFSIIGFYVPSIFLLIHFWLYKRAIFIRGKWLFIYAASFYPLVMQFFQDQYFSLFSMHVQIVLWCMLFFKSSHQEKSKHD